MRLAELRIFPVKSLGEVQLDEAAVEPWGLAHDRRWMLVDDAGRFITQRTHPMLARLRPRILPDGLAIAAPDRETLHIACPGPDAALRQVVIWSDAVPARDAGNEAAAFLSGFLGTSCRLVHLHDPRARKLNPRYAVSDVESVSFADGAPLLLTSAGSLADLNARMNTPVPMARFRPNLVVEGAEPWAEDSWLRIRIGAVTFRAIKPCERCIVTTTDQITGARENPKEPLRTLATFRRSDIWNGVLFGENLVPETSGVVRLGDLVEVLELRAG